jgi:hypothetical protein
MAKVTMQGGEKKVSNILLFIGVVALVTAGVMAISVDSRLHALVAYIVGFAVSVGFGLGCLGYVMIFQQTNAGWSTSIRRIAEVVASCLPSCAILFIPILFFAPTIYHWFHDTTNPIYEKKETYLSPTFWYLRSGFYFLVWSIFAWRLYAYSRQQDQNGDKWLTAKARRLSAPGLLIFALTLAFASFDWLMGLDYHWFSTMFGVYFFAGAIQSATALCIVIAGFLKLKGEFGDLVTEEHFHDLGKLLMAFTVFWAYIAFGQYFLIWYSNLPEETHWFQLRAAHGWEDVGYLLAFGRFLVPFLFLLWRNTKRIIPLLIAISLWQIFMQGVDMFYVARPAVSMHTGLPGVHFDFVDIVAPLGPILIFLGVVVRRLGAAPIVPIRDPRLAESQQHMNYV